MKLKSNATIPIKAHDTDACYDMIATSINKTEQYIEYGTNIAFHIPKGYVGLIFPRSSVTKEDLMLKNSVGIIDSGYLGEVMFRFTKIVNSAFHEMTLSNGTHSDGINKVIDIKVIERELQIYNIGDRIGQIMFIKLPKTKLIVVDDFDETKRGVGGFGSTGK